MAQNTALQELITQIKGAISIIDRHGVLNDYAHQRKDVYVSILDVATELLPKERQDISDNVCSFLDWIHSEGWMVFRSTPEIIWFKEGAYAMKTNEQLYYYFTYTKNK